MLKKLSASFAVGALLVVSASAVMPALAVDGVTTPEVKVAVATCEDPHNTVTVSGLAGVDTKNYRFVLVSNGVNERLLNTKIRNALYAGPVTEEDLAGLSGLSLETLKANGLYEKTFQIKAYVRDKEGKLSGKRETVKVAHGDALTKAIFLSASAAVKLVDPSTLDCKKVDEPKSDGPMSDAPKADQPMSVKPKTETPRDAKEGIVPPYKTLPTKSDAGVTVAPKQAVKAVGAKVGFTASGFTAGEKINFFVHSKVVYIGSTIADAQGNAALKWTVPADFELGKHFVTANGVDSQKTAVNEFTVVKTDKDAQELLAKKKGLAKTGMTLGITFAGLAAAAAGAGAMRISRRKS